MPPDQKRDYEVGHGKPPRHTRFKKGQSGNPRGRPKGSKNLPTLLTEALNEPVVVAENGKRSATADLRAMKQLPPFPAIRAFFDEVIELSMTDEQRRECMLVNAALELAPYDGEFEKVVSQETAFKPHGLFCRASPAP
jgi:hypothetical protein